ncbi:MAG TPA: hypothetical protein VLE69_01715 [Candidatus Saccharimonadales bacterium]|nr:hypothetical protein [Candidatus Saccharimonadales bacterium]
MPNQNRFIHDRLILLLLSVSTFLVILGSLLIGLRLGNGQGGGYIVQYRSNLGISAFKTGGQIELLAFIVFMVLVLVLHTLVSIRAYRVRREYAATVLGMGLLLIVMAIVVSNALLVT